VSGRGWCCPAPGLSPGKDVSSTSVYTDASAQPASGSAHAAEGGSVLKVREIGGSLTGGDQENCLQGPQWGGEPRVCLTGMHDTMEPGGGDVENQNGIP